MVTKTDNHKSIWHAHFSITLFLSLHVKCCLWATSCGWVSILCLINYDCVIFQDHLFIKMTFDLVMTMITSAYLGKIVCCSSFVQPDLLCWWATRVLEISITPCYNINAVGFLSCPWSLVCLSVRDYFVCWIRCSDCVIIQSIRLFHVNAACLSDFQQ